MRTLQTVVIGLGRIGWQFHLPEIHKHPQFELVGVVDPLSERLKEAETAYGVAGYSDYRQMLQAAQVDLVVIASPTHLHREQAIAAMDAGIDVFCDKPVAVSLQETDAMIECMQRTGRKLMVYQPHRAKSEMLAAQSIVSRGILGPIYQVKRTVANYTRRNDWQALRKFGGGMLMNFGAHYIDQSLYLVGGTVVDSYASIRSIVTLGDADDVVKLLLTTDAEVMLDVEINLACALPQAPWTIFGKYGTAALELDGSAFQVRYVDPRTLPTATVNETLAATGRAYGNSEVLDWQQERVEVAPFTAIDYYEKVYAYFAQDEAPFVPIAQTRAVMQVIERVKSEG